MELVISKPKAWDKDSMVTLTVQQGSVSLWKFPFKGGATNEFHLNPVSHSISFNVDKVFRNGSIVLWVEAMNKSTVMRDIQLVLSRSEGGPTDTAAATAVWADATDSYLDPPYDAAAVFYDDPWDQVNGDARNIIELAKGTGKRPDGLVTNVIGVKLKGVYDAMIVQFQLTPTKEPDGSDLNWNNYPVYPFIEQREEDFQWTQGDLNQPWVRTITVFPPINPDTANDSPYRSNGILPEGYLYSADLTGPGLRVPRPDLQGTRLFDARTFETWVGIDFKNPKQPGDIATITKYYGTRGSDFFNWHSTVLVDYDVNGDLERLGGDFGANTIPLRAPS
jgi:hypothetical protein